MSDDVLKEFSASTEAAAVELIMTTAQSGIGDSFLLLEPSFLAAEAARRDEVMWGADYCAQFSTHFLLILSRSKGLGL